ncbi:hypothetical protein K503DRAFT_870221 [Rhizopogon vinicolor AM-OR11-026]|uniref:P-loop containing nucleoside triphosphate hydrolase protein n=1 Tax=Rhizopogon vinicolor AM-OR11-026 TaxID=1314800 RepID=A0A1B7MI97_9AGAM|nr:hypothetical protein K503DRAFT_870221 [Rhizopogon vinicolor AM-OR11-026]
MSKRSLVRQTMLDLLSKDRIIDAAGLRAAINALSTLAPTGLQAVVEHLLSVPEVFAYIISVWDRCDCMISQIMTDFPTKSQEYPSSLASKVLDRLSMYFLALPVESLAMKVSRDISRNRGFIESALPLLCTLNIMTFANERTSDAATSLTIAILAELKEILSFYFSLLRRTELAGVIKAFLLSNAGGSAQDVSPEVSSNEVVESPAQRPSAYPMVQPMKAALYFDNADGFGVWRILISTVGYKNLREYRRADVKVFKIIVKKIKQLSNGHFSDDNQKRLNGPDAGVPIHEAKMTRDLRLVYQVDCVPDHDGESERQVIKVYGIYTHAQLDRIWDALGIHLARKGREYRRRVIFRNKPVIPNDNVILPASFPPAEPEPECTESPLDLSDKDMDHLHSLLVYEVSSSPGEIRRILASVPTQSHRKPRHTARLHAHIVECTTSSYVLGRGGTGKTTTMLFKILGIQKAWETNTLDMPKPRQIFVTKSRVLATKAEEYFTKLLESLALADYTLQELAKLKAQSVQVDLLDLDDTPESQMNIPMRYSELEDKHFPLFITFDRQR